MSCPLGDGGGGGDGDVSAYASIGILLRDG